MRIRTQNLCYIFVVWQYRHTI
uniref:Uncharacterized protein n=1 Tax=Anguilla anguilla TaxID=7936 RepID=A0A0E9T432_ANGAN